MQDVDIRETSINLKGLGKPCSETCLGARSDASIPVAFTSDNVPVSVSGSLFFRIRDSYSACFSVHDVHFNVEKLGTSAMPSVIGQFTYDKIISDRNRLNTKLHEVIGSTTEVRLAPLPILSLLPSRVIHCRIGE